MNTHDIDRDGYVARVLASYRATPGTIGQARGADRALAIALHQRGVALELVEAALQLGALRRERRDAGQPPLTPVRALHYFLPVLDELLATPPDPAYLRYLRARAQSITMTAQERARPHACGVDDAAPDPIPACPHDQNR